MDRLKELIKRCDGEISLNVNPHTTGYDSAGEYFENLEICGIDLLFDPFTRKRMIELNTIVELCFYPDPNTPIGYYMVHHYELDAVLDMALEILNSERLHA